MKVLIILSMAMGMSMASLEPSGYHPPDSHDISTDLYLPPSSSSSSSSPRGVQTPDFHYLPSTSHQSASSQNVIPNSLFGNHGQTHSHHQQQQHQQHLSGLSASQSMSQYLPPSNQYLPSQLSPPSNQYLPSSSSQQLIPSNSQLSSSSSNHQSRRKNSLNNRQRQLLYNSNTDKIGSRMTYERNNLQSHEQHSKTFTQAIPSSTYLSANKNQYQTDLNLPSNDIQPPSNSYLTPNQLQMSGGYSNTQNQDRQSSAGHYYPDSGYPEAKNKGYNYDPPAKYEFEYMVNDHESGNDFGHKESREGDVTRGTYFVLLPDNRRQKIEYIADANGYRPTITYEDAGAGRAGYDQGYHY